MGLWVGMDFVERIGRGDGAAGSALGRVAAAEEAADQGEEGDDDGGVAAPPAPGVDQEDAGRQQTGAHEEAEPHPGEAGGVVAAGLRLFGLELGAGEGVDVPLLGLGEIHDVLHGVRVVAREGLDGFGGRVEALLEPELLAAAPPVHDLPLGAHRARLPAPAFPQAREM